ncbi:MAG: MBL fold metallo-hydrolase, partial [Firmicutes bacterium]|nr:MBL fold metallo-hydrolase [Bacillota bacterium]
YLQKQTGCAIYAPGIEADFTNHPILESAFLYGGYPMKELRHKFLLAQESDAAYLSAEQLPTGVEVISLPGHSFEMVGFRTADDMVYLADCLSSKETLEKYRIGFIYDIASYLQTLELVKNMKAKLFIPSHAAATEDIAELAQYNIDVVMEIAEAIVLFCGEPHSFEEILQQLFEQYGLTMTYEQHVLVGSTVRSYLSWLKESGRLEVCFENNRQVWKKS